MLERTRFRAGGFTAVELVIVLSIATILTTMVVAASLPAIRRARLTEAVGAIEQVWREARTLAMSTRPARAQPGVANIPKHYGVLVRQNGPGDTYVALIWSNQSASAVIAGSDAAMLHQDPNDSSTPYVRRIAISRSFALAWSTGAGAPTVSDGGGLVWYAQYSTGLPVDPAQVVAGTAGSSVVTPIGANGSTVATSLRVQSLDWSPSPHRGMAMALSIYQAGITAHEEL